MLSKQDLVTFNSIASHQPRFRQWLMEELGKQTEILVVGIDERQIRQAQGYAQCLKQIVSNLDASLTSR